MNKPNHKIGIVGSGSFGTAIATIISKNADVLIYCRRQEIADKINISRRHKNTDIPDNIKATTDLAEIGEQCNLIFPIVPSEQFRSVMKALSPHVGPEHIMIHGTKGLDVKPSFMEATAITEIKNSVFTMNEVMRQETSVLRTGCLAGPNLAKEILEGQPAATVIASEFNEVIELGRSTLASINFIVYGSHNLKGIELAGALKNVVAISSGIMNGMGFGKNMEALLITRGLREMIHIARAVGAEVRPFLGTAGIGDLIATSTSSKSRNYTFGTLIADGKSVEEIKNIMEEVAEGYRTVRFAYKVSQAASLQTPMIETLYKIVYESVPVQKALLNLIRHPLEVDVDFL